MAKLKILTYPDQFLRKTAKPVKIVDQEVQKLIEDMTETMYDSSGAGLAAIQVGVDAKIIVYDSAQKEEERGSPGALINPEIVWSKGSITSENEGCLSVINFKSNVKRAERIRVTGLDKEGRKVDMEVDGILSVIIQHEVDHLKGVLFIDKVSPLKRQLYKKRIKKSLKKKKYEKS